MAFDSGEGERFWGRDSMDRLDGLTDRVLREMFEACGMVVSSSADNLNGASFWCSSSVWLLVMVVVVVVVVVVVAAVGLKLFVSLPSTELFTEPRLGVLEAKVVVLIDEQESFPKSGL